MNHDIFLRAHTVSPPKSSPKAATGPKWPERVLVFDTETTIDTRQDLTLGVYRLCQLAGGSYNCSEEGIFHGDNLDNGQRETLEAYVRSEHADIEVRTFPPKLRLTLLSRSKFVEKVFWKALKDGYMPVGFNLPFDLSRLAVDWCRARNGGWSLILSMRRSRKTGKMEPDPDRPRIRITSKDSKTAFIGLTRPRVAAEWPSPGRFLDLHTLALAHFGESYKLEGLCDALDIPGKLKHKPTGRVSRSEIEYCRRDVQVTTSVLNSLKRELDQHPIELNPDRAFSPASIANTAVRLKVE
jgi:hypothetical protein